MVNIFGGAFPIIGPVLEFVSDVFFDDDDSSGQLAAQIATVATGVPVPIAAVAPAPAPLPQDPFSQQSRGRCPSGAVPLIPGQLNPTSCPNPDFMQFLPQQTAFIGAGQDAETELALEVLRREVEEPTFPLGFPALSQRAVEGVFGPDVPAGGTTMPMQQLATRNGALLPSIPGFAPKDEALAQMLVAANNNWTDGQIRAIARKARYTLADLRIQVLDPQVMFFIWNAIGMAGQQAGAHGRRLSLMNQVNNALEGLAKRRRRGMSLKTLKRAGREAKKVARALKDLLPPEIVKRAKIKRKKC